ncbi:hypothetical protein PROFUN_12827 [Planoprotostelium fungivorum]|uniref:Uncharacterized protein n=1 Tax=Planoprotostelium fungivorum TaxID=1890364 RepID=A0A2P6N6H7_9EUKA|nr:hypothetical protein PROFUN_12827 [Planoprotostelium fungivorum]
MARCLRGIKDLPKYHRRPTSRSLGPYSIDQVMFRQCKMFNSASCAVNIQSIVAAFAAP